ncbi:PDZ domain-containing protein [Streptacidiphilus sp. PB12-B1b]|uniref:S1C family serine protease n=1 Tax=Streptacidiphilus sp. PB12-B1b TaxID=2705012 RepID=UPI0015FE1833|nr:trypsin-like peptidase domain-containing protein [Streptacidiphilus sp. PB12-B1b]QMU75195.1 PDZ domain-containing protein [Streptacidiphilus sp. PB12-B1b]
MVVCAGLLGGGVGAVVQGQQQGGRITLQPVPGASRHLGPDSTADVVQAALPGVVYLHVSDGSDSVTGTGVVLDGKGHILTNNHVVAPLGRPGRITVVFTSGQQHAAAVVGRDPVADLAVIQVDGVTGLRPIALGSAAGLRVGDPVLAIGDPFGLRSTVTSGIVSSLDRPVTMAATGSGGPAYLDALQTDAAINPGNSGGPLLDSAGEVVGVNTAIRSADPDAADPYGADDEAGSDGIGFAIPIDQAMRVAEQLIDGVPVTRTALGVLLDTGYQGGGRVLRTTPGSAAAVAGLHPGDVVTAVDGTPVGSADDLVALVRGRAPDAPARLTVQRAGAELVVPVRLRAVRGTPADGVA